MIVIKVYYIDLKKHNIDQKQASAFLKKTVLKDAEIFCTENGKPYCKDLFFNVSHSGDFVVLCTAEKEVGIDLEKIRDVNFKIADRCFNENESVSTKEEFFKMWTKKESIIKCFGKTVGDMKSIDSFEFSRLLRQSGFFEGYAFCVCSEDKTEIEFIGLRVKS